jgi:hypothetical protein
VEVKYESQLLAGEIGTRHLHFTLPEYLGALQEPFNSSTPTSSGDCNNLHYQNAGNISHASINSASFQNKIASLISSARRAEEHALHSLNSRCIVQAPRA